MLPIFTKVTSTTCLASFCWHQKTSPNLNSRRSLGLPSEVFVVFTVQLKIQSCQDLRSGMMSTQKLGPKMLSEIETGPFPSFCSGHVQSMVSFSGNPQVLQNFMPHPEDQNNVTSSSGCMNSGTWFHVNMVAECHVLLFHTFLTVQLCIRSMFSLRLRVQLAQEVTKTI